MVSFFPGSRHGAGRLVRRTGFTIVELLVALALVVFIMAILADAFATASNSFRLLKGMGDLAEKLRSASSIIRRDLSTDHFERKKRLSDPSFWINGPPQEGFFRIYQNTAPVTTNNPNATYWLEGYDLDGLPSYRATNHALHFTVKLRGVQRSDFFTASIPTTSPLTTWNVAAGFQPLNRYQDSPSIFTSQWAEVAYFLQATGDQTDGANPQPLYALYRRQRLLLPDTSSARYADAANATQYPEVSIFSPAAPYTTAPATTAGSFNSSVDVTLPYRRFGMNPNAPAGTFAAGTTNYPTMAQQYAAGTALGLLYDGADVLVTDVLSFEVRPYFALSTGTGLVSAAGSAFTPLNDAVLVPYRNGNPNFFAANGPFVFDTWSQNLRTSENYSDYSTTWATRGTTHSIPLYANAAGSVLTVRAIQIVLRVYDYKTFQTRQMTIVQDL